MQKGIPEDATIVVEMQLMGIKEKTGRFYNMDADSDEKITYQEFRAYFQAKVKCQN